MQTPEAGADSTSTVPLQTSVPVQPPGSTQQVPVQPQVLPAPVSASSCPHVWRFPAGLWAMSKPATVSCVQAQTVQQVQHVYPAQVQYVEENSGVYTNGNM